MIYYHYRPDADTFRCVEFNDADFERALEDRRSDSPVIETWSPPVVTEFDEDVDRPIGDFPTFNSSWEIPIMSQRAWDALSPLIGPYCEALPIVHPSGQPFYIVHAMNTIDALDEDQSDLVRSEIDGRVSVVYRYRLKERLLKDQHLFKLPLESGGETFVDHTFREAVEKHHLRGLTFTAIPMVDETPDNAR